MKEIFDSCLTKEEYSYTLENASLSKITGILNLDVKLNFIISIDKMEQIKTKLIATIPGVSDVNINFIYCDIKKSTKELVEMYLQNIDVFFYREEVCMTMLVKNCKVAVDGNEIILFVAGEAMAEILNSNEASIITGNFNRYFNTNLNFRFVSDKDALSNALDKIKAENDKIKEMPVVRDTSSSVSLDNKDKSRDKSKYTKKNKEKILTREIVGEATDMFDFGKSNNECILEGEIFGVTVKEINDNKVIVVVLFSDLTTSVCGKMYLKQDIWDEVKSVVKEGNSIRAKGKPTFDEYSQSTVLNIRNIALVEKQERVDTAEKKRVELHAHTKMSSLDGLSDVGSYIKLAKKWGHPAVAITDHGVVQAFPEAAKAAGGEIKVIYGLEGYLLDDKDLIREDGSIDYKNKFKKTNHIIILAKNQIGLKNLYKLVSLSHLDYFYKKPRIPRSILIENREGLIIGSACEAGEVFRGLVNGSSDEELKELVQFYDYLEIQPLINNEFLIKRELATSKEDLKNFNRKIVELGEVCNKPVVATCDAHYIHPQDASYRRVIMAGQGYKDLGAGGLYFRTTDEMIEEFSYLGDEKAYEVVVTNTNKVADMIEELRPVPKGKFPPFIENSDKILRESCYEKAYEIYGKPLPEKIEKRLREELDAIIGEGYAVMYVSAKMLVDKSLQDGYLVGSRGSVGSSFAATMAGITEVNPLPPHYVCPSCKHLEWGDENLYDCGVDMPQKECDKCGITFKQDGFTIPFETFLGIPGKIKEPDIDLNFAGEYQGTAHKYVDEIFGAENVFKAGTIGTIATKTAFGFAKKYSDERNMGINKYEIERLAKGCEGVKRTTGQHPGGIIILPKGHEIYEFCPVQRPANDVNSEFITTHFDYHAIDENLLKLDILGHDAPSIIRHLQDMTGIDPISLPLKDENVNKIFIGVESLGIKDDDYIFEHGSFGIPEFGTKFVRGMLDDTHPEKFADLVRISGFSHGTDVWLGNAKDYIKDGTATMQNAISTRDDIMNYLILRGVEPITAFTIMEKVRKGKGVSDEEADKMKEKGTPQWYVDSCRKIKYMFPRAHAVAYVMMAYRIAWFKVYRPEAFYAAHLTTKIEDFNWDVIKQGKKSILERMNEILSKGNNATTKENNELLVLEICYEMYARGIEFEKPSFEMSQDSKFYISNKLNDEEFAKVIVPLRALNGVGENCAKQVLSEFKQRAFQSVEEIQLRGKANKSAIEKFRENGLLDGLPESNQMTFF